MAKALFSKDEIEKIVSIASEAGLILSEFFKQKNFEIFTKEDGSKVTSADLEVSKFLRQKLMENFSFPLICEEGTLREISTETFWVIDPLDGTSSFTSGSNQFALNIALVQNKKAVFGLIYAPLFEGGKMFFSNEKNEVVFVGKKSEKQNSQALQIVASARVNDDAVEKYVAQFHPSFSQNFIVEKLSSAVKFFRLFERKTDLYLHLRPSMEWDTAAGQALLELMGGKVKTLNSNLEKFVLNGDLSYAKPGFANEEFVAFFDKKS